MGGLEENQHDHELNIAIRWQPGDTSEKIFGKSRTIDMLLSLRTILLFRAWRYNQTSKDWHYPNSLIDPRDQLSVLLSYPIFDLSVGYRQIKSEPMMFVMLSYSWLFPRAYTIISFGSDQCYHRVHMMVEVQWYGNSDELLLSPSAASRLLHDSCWTLS